MDFNKEKQKIDTILSTAKKVLITAHKSPDPDALGCTIAFKWYVDKYFPNVKSKICFTGSIGEIGERYSFLQGHKYLNDVDDIADLKKDYDTFVFLDGSELYRFTEFEDKFNLSEVKSICIDHHVGEPSDFDYYFRDTSYASCSEIVCEILLSDDDLKDSLVSEAIFIGIHGDTGGFVFVPPQKAKVFDTARRVVENGNIDVQTLLLNLNSIKEDHFDLMKILVDRTKSVVLKNSKVPNFTYSYFTKKDIKGLTSAQVKPGRALYIANYLRRIEGYTWGFVITPPIDKPKFVLSLRSVPKSLNVQELGKAFGGGGHIHAGGGDLTAEVLGVSENEFKKLTSEDVCKSVINRVQELFDEGVVGLT